MNFKYKLAIAIPTYNRADILSENIETMLPELIAHQIPIYISDDSSDTKTAQVLKKISYQNIFYTSNKPSHGHDKNCISTLNLPDAEYIWYLGDSIYITPGFIEKILRQIDDQKPDIICVNAPHRISNTMSRTVYDKKNFLIETAWHLTLTGSSIYRKSAISFHNLDIRKWKNFPQTGITLSIVLKPDSKVIWIGEESITTNPKKNSYWSKNVIDVFARDWCNFVQSFAEYFTKNELEKLELSHSLNTKILSTKALIMYRSQNNYNHELYSIHYAFLRRSSQCKKILLFLISITPQTVCKFIFQIYKTIKTNLNLLQINLKNSDSKRNNAEM
ncbi:glycosyltransferase family 2 protein [Vogesella sp. LYT5W]|uniref:Glycosyltransferase family 2 protein n=1 Tax=Vogesella margarita TaxID=2984199 RepID=A0ABT5IR23_9NEIS|nr:glycosyltransferase family 2 protein [Vogesella margarita]MDC7714636.1 glycosyltransferase family 2 protein [Vogesella margarita]